MGKEVKKDGESGSHGWAVQDEDMGKAVGKDWKFVRQGCGGMY